MPIMALQGAGRVEAQRRASGLIALSRAGRIEALLVEAVAPVAPPTNISAPVASGIVRVGQTVSSTIGVWAGAVGYSFRWTLNGVDIPGEIASSHVVTSDDMAGELRCVITASGPGGVAEHASNALTSVWRPALQILGDDGFLWVMSAAETGAAPGAPVSAVYDVAGQQALVQALTAAQPTQQVDHLAFVADDYLTGDQPEIYGIFARANPAPISSMIVLTAPSSSSSQVLYAASASGVTNRNYSVTGQGRAVGRPALARFGATTIPANKPMWMIDAAPTSSQATRVLDAAESVDGYIGGVDTANNFTLGGRRRVAPEAFITNGVKALLICARALDATERAAIRAVLDAQGVTTP